MKMNKLLCVVVLCLLSLSMIAKTESKERDDISSHTYYVDATHGDDANVGTSKRSPLRTLQKVSALPLRAGDKILLKRGEVFEGKLELSGCGTEARPIVVSSYSSGVAPLVQGSDSSLYAVRIYNSSYLTLRNIEIVNHGEQRLAKRTGLKIECKDFGTSKNIVVENLTIRDVNGSLVKEEGGGSAILIFNGGNRIRSRFEGLRILHNHIVNCSRNAIIWNTDYFDRRKWFPSRDIVFRGNLIEQVPGDGIVPEGCDGTLIEYNVMRDCPDILPASEAAAGFWPWSCDNTTIQYNDVSGHKAPWDAQAYDCDYNSRHTLVQFNYSHDNYGGMVLVCDNGEQRDYNIGNIGSVVQYNISIGDGIRPKKTRTGGYFSPNIHIAGRVTNSTIRHNIVHSNEKNFKDADRSMVTSDDWGGFADGTSFTDNIFYTAELSRFNMTKSTHNLFSGNFYIGKYMDLPVDSDAKLSSRIYDEKVLSYGSDGYRGLKRLMKKRELFGHVFYVVNEKAIKKFFRDMAK